jgi:uncharacterized repeat protein (TIGR03943 family)
MPKRLYRSYQALLLLGLFLFLMSKVVNNQLLWYINLRFVVLTQVGIVLLAILSQRLFTEARRLRQDNGDEGHAHDHNHKPFDAAQGRPAANLWIMFLPLLIGLLIPARPLDASAVSAKGLATSSPLISAEASSRLFETESEQRNILDWIKLFHFEKDLNPYIGQQASVVGFVYRDERLPSGQFFVSRFILSCCAADGYAVGMIVEWAGSGSLEQNAWVQVKGTVDAISFEGRISPLVRAEAVEFVPQPDQPYLYP